MNILVLNCGSSSVKFQLIETAGDHGATDRDRKLVSGLVEGLGDHARFTIKSAGGASCSEDALAVPSHESAACLIIERLRSGAAGDRGAVSAVSIDAVGHRVVHGGEIFTAATAIDEDVIGKLDSLNLLAPLHNPAAISAIHAARRTFGASMPMAAVFDTAFHRTVPEVAAVYAIPDALSKKYGIRRYGFHGLAHRYSLLRYRELTGASERQVNIVTLHLGNGCSACAIRAGQSVDTSMGFTPLEGLVMGTRSGDLDPAVVSYLTRAERVGATDVEHWLNERSGLLGLSGISHDMRELVAAYETAPSARLAVDVFCYRARKYLGAYLAVLGGADAVVFSGGIGEHTPMVRGKICDGMEWCGLSLDEDRNNSTVGGEGSIAAAGARVRVFVIPSDEEAVIARETARLFNRAAS